MRTEKEVQTKSSARGFVGLHANGNVVGETLNMKPETQLHPCKKILEDLLSKGIINSAEKNITLGHLNFSNFKVDELATAVEQDVMAQRGLEINR
ncbi:MAG: hypothetical protein KIG16_01040 [Eubacteriales bacterium]|nr:hypothetical protein [Eubacteriales bacterium]